MVTHYFTLHALSAELNALLQGLTFREIYTQNKDEVMMTLHHPQSDSLQTLCISVTPKLNYCYLRSNVSRAKKNSVDLFEEINDARIKDVSVPEYDRTLQIRFDNTLRFLFRLYNTAESNLFLIDDNNSIHETFKNNKIFKGTAYSKKPNVSFSHMIDDVEAFVAAITNEPSKTIIDAMKRACPLLGTIYSVEVLYRARVEKDTPVQKMDRLQFLNLHQHIHDMLREVEPPRPAIYVQNNTAPVLSVIPLRHLTDATVTSYNSVSDAIRFRISRTMRTSDIASDKNELVKKISSELERLKKATARMSHDANTAQRSEEYQRIGTLLMANLHTMSRGLSTIDLPDTLGDGTLLHITLDPSLTPTRNAERYFEKAKKSKGAQADAERRLKTTEQQIALLEKLLSDLNNCETQEELKHFQEQYRHELTTMKLIPPSPDKEQVPFRVFQVSGGFEVWVGKSSANNDLLTMKYTKPHDLWFHVRGAGGSHTVLKAHKGETPPPKETIRQAAAIAAYYSKMRKAGSVPVAYCERKYVRKPKGAKEGAVTLEREKVIFVQPKLPEQAEREILS